MRGERRYIPSSIVRLIPIITPVYRGLLEVVCIFCMRAVFSRKCSIIQSYPASHNSHPTHLALISFSPFNCDALSSFILSYIPSDIHHIPWILIF